eukprot:CAMPEP_0172368328 /NCGR_PEP_ID=MMETSP1060-20121228/26446_1 /TAXON_ID=37318 /ORGANISM="Pseudo-nitzschia pungens, Strain cf. cingulata" /LENGTH=33 /DNA_ID= /DNA_START= /DNA_END= /DNA_ORIENTATION=
MAQRGRTDGDLIVVFRLCRVALPMKENDGTANP